jgi:hypothetical protein
MIGASPTANRRIAQRHVRPPNSRTTLPKSPTYFDPQIAPSRAIAAGNDRCACPARRLVSDRLPSRGTVCPVHQSTATIPSHMAFRASTACCYVSKHRHSIVRHRPKCNIRLRSVNSRHLGIEFQQHAWRTINGCSAKSGTDLPGPKDYLF